MLSKKLWSRQIGELHPVLDCGLSVNLSTTMSDEECYSFPLVASKAESIIMEGMQYDSKRQTTEPYLPRSREQLASPKELCFSVLVWENAFCTFSCLVFNIFSSNIFSSLPRIPLCMSLLINPSQWYHTNIYHFAQILFCWEVGIYERF